jgi:uncharacterized membrane protein YgcG
VQLRARIPPLQSIVRHVIMDKHRRNDWYAPVPAGILLMSVLSLIVAATLLAGSCSGGAGLEGGEGDGGGGGGVRDGGGGGGGGGVTVQTSSAFSPKVARDVYRHCERL